MDWSQQRDEGPRVGLVLGAGGTAGGAFTRGALAAIDELTGWRPWSAVTVVGTSIGALGGARISAPTPEDRGSEHSPFDLFELAKRMPSLEARLGHRTVVAGRRLGGRFVALASPAGKITADYPVGESPYHPGLQTISVLRRRGKRIATRLVDAADPTQLLYASAAVPMVNAPVSVLGREHIDGAVFSSTNADLVSPDDHDLLIVIAPMVADTGGSWLARTHRAQLVSELEPWVAAGRPTVVVAPSGDDVKKKHDHEAFGLSGHAKVARVR